MVWILPTNPQNAINARMRNVNWSGEPEDFRNVEAAERFGWFRGGAVLSGESVKISMNVFLTFVCLVALLAGRTFAEEPRTLPAAHTMQQIEGWNVRVDDRLLTGADAAVGARALKLLGARLVAIETVVPEAALAKLRAVTIELDRDYGELRIMQYHPDSGWLTAHGYSAELAKCVHIPVAEEFLSPFENRRMPWVVLHELAHAFHDQTLGFDDARIEAVWVKFRDSGKYKSVLTSVGGMREHYGLTNAKEFFAEMTESYFGSNDFYPFVAGELQQGEPGIFALLREIWGPLPERGKAMPGVK